MYDCICMCVCTGICICDIFVKRYCDIFLGLVKCGHLSKGGEMKVDELKDWISNWVGLCEVQECRKPKK